LCRFERGYGTSSNYEKAYSIFDAGIEFQPLTRQFREFEEARNRKFFKYIKPSSYYRWFKRRWLSGLKPLDRVYDYQDIINNDLAYDFQNGKPIFPGVCPAWDNSARRPHDTALIFDRSTPDRFKYWIEGKINCTKWSLLPECFLFVNAWNEWAEGNHLEPCERWETAYLDALQKSI
jgi:hypothetical protein